MTPTDRDEAGATRAFAAVPEVGDLTPQQRAVFDVLAQRRGSVVSRSELSRRAGLGDLSARRCDSLLVDIRRQIGSDRIVTVRRRGWMLVG